MAHSRRHRSLVADHPRRWYPLYARKSQVSSIPTCRAQSLTLARRWLTAHGRFPEARAAIARTRGIPEAEAENHSFVQREVRSARGLRTHQS